MHFPITCTRRLWLFVVTAVMAVASTREPAASQTVPLQAAAAAALAPSNPVMLYHASNSANEAGQCPPWFGAYETFHLAARSQPGTKYLIHQVPEHTVGKSGGLGDRLRGMLYALRLAAASGRVLLFSWSRPVELHHLLVPSAHINWTLAGIPELSRGIPPDALVLRFMNGHHHPVVLNGNLTNLTEQFVVVQTNQHMDAECPACPALHPTTSSTACTWARLFKPADDVIAQAEQQLQQLYGSSNVTQYVAIHLRLGGFTGEAEHERGSGPLKNFAGAVRCANRLAQQHNISSSTPLLMVTDNHHLRSFIREGHLRHVVGPNTQSVHIDQALNLDDNARAHRSTVVDLVLLSRAVCLVTSPGYRHGSLSGFSHHAWLLGGAKPCRVDFRKCI